MKKIFLAGLIGFYGLSGYAQAGFYLAPMAGGGISSSSGAGFLLSTNPKSPIYAQEYQVGLGYSFHNWQLETGLGYATTGAHGVGYLWRSVGYWGGVLVFTPPPAYTATTINRHILAPLSVRYNILMGKRLSVVPGLGIEWLYNYATETRNVSNEAFTDVANTYDHFKTVTPALLYSLECGWKLNDKWSILAGPNMQHMLKPVTTQPGFGYDYAYVFNAGLKYQISKRKRAVELQK